ncbi:MAG: hypothetical protein QJR03_12790 [Sphaerobacter sp.]|nr:hypothetical protein [Sphaerobacter sp.]MDI3341398.1 hypothetical protein [Sphaerobacter sp.]
MRRRIGLALIAALAAALLAPLAALGGGWSVVVLDALPGTVTPGEELTIGFRVLQHGQIPMRGLAPQVVLTHAESGAVVRAIGTKEGETGHYVARVTLPAAGTWQWHIDAFEGPHPMPPLAVGAAPAISTAESPAASGIVTWLAEARLPLVGLAVASTLAAAGLLLRTRRLVVVRHA